MHLYDCLLILAVRICILYLIHVLFDIFSVCVAAQGEERECAYAEHQQALADRIGGGGEGRVFLENSTIRCSQGGWCYGLWEKKQHGVRLVKQGT